MALPTYLSLAWENQFTILDVTWRYQHTCLLLGKINFSSLPFSLFQVEKSCYLYVNKCQHSIQNNHWKMCTHKSYGRCCYDSPCWIGKSLLNISQGNNLNFILHHANTSVVVVVHERTFTV